MTSKEFLQQYRVCCRKYKAILESIEQLRAMAEKTTHAFSADRVSGSSSDRLGSLSAILADAETDAKAELQTLAAKKKEVEQVIQTVPCDNQRNVLYHRYILQKKWEQIAVDLGFDYRWVTRLHGEALQSIVIEQVDFVNGETANSNSPLKAPIFCDIV